MYGSRRPKKEVKYLFIRESLPLKARMWWMRGIYCRLGVKTKQADDLPHEHNVNVSAYAAVVEGHQHEAEFPDGRVVRTQSVRRWMN
jgi:hypothetical protein